MKPPRYAPLWEFYYFAIISMAIQLVVIVLVVGKVLKNNAEQHEAVQQLLISDDKLQTTVQELNSRIVDLEDGKVKNKKKRRDRNKRIDSGNVSPKPC